MYLKFTTEQECNIFLDEIAKRMGLNANLTSKFATPRLDTVGNYIIPKPKNSVLSEVKKLIRDIKVNTFDEEGNDIISDGIEIVKKQFDEEGNDVTVYDSTEYELVTQTALVYTEIENPAFPIEEVDV